MNFLKRLYKSHDHRKRRTAILSSMNLGARPNQYFLISYPKSGNTWMRMILANLLREDDQEIALHNVNSYVPDTHLEGRFASVLGEQTVFSRLPYQFLKTHDPYLPYYRDKQVVYLVRDGRDALNSYYHYLKARKQSPILMGDLIQGKHDVPQGVWSRHVCNWARGTCARKIIIRYEDLIADTTAEVRRLLNFLKWELDEQAVRAAIEDSSFQNLKRLEEKHGWMQEARTESGRNTPFFRRGQVSDWRNTFSEADLEAFWKRHEAGMRLFGYR